MNDKQLIDTIASLKERHQKMRDNTIRLQGEIDALWTEMKNKYFCNSLKDFEELITKTENELEAVQVKLNAAVKTFQERYFENN